MAVDAFRRLARMNGWYWLSLCIAVLAMRLLVPAGYMPVVEAGRLAILACPDAGIMPPVMAGIDHAGRDHATISPHGNGHAKGHGDRDGRHDGPVCAFAGLSVPLLGGVDPVLLVAALALVAAAALATPSVRTVRAALRLRPPLRGPPAPASPRR